jgi:threonine-phosphate decarboxylase
MSNYGIKERSDQTQQLLSWHGGKVYEAAQRWGVSPDEVFDFSANINPLGPPHRVLSAIEETCRSASLRSYPDDQLFVEALVNKHQLTPAQIVVGSGTASLMFAVMHAIRPQRVLLLEPAFAEYARSCDAVNAEVARWLLSEGNGFNPDFARLESVIKERQFDLVVINSPHNPTGNIYPTASLRSLIDAAEEHDTVVLLDEAFIDYASDQSLISFATTKRNLIVLRSLTKFYSMPGLRVGYAITDASLATKIRRQVDPWSVSMVALESARTALNDDDFIAESLRLNAVVRNEFTTALRDVGLLVFPSAANFVLVKLPEGLGTDLQQWLESKRILIRTCDSFLGLGDAFIRLAVRISAENIRLVSLIKQWLSGSGV